MKDDLTVPFLIKGKGIAPSEGGCIMQIADWISTGGWTDRPAFVHKTLRNFALNANDGSTDDQRQELLDLLPRLLNTSGLLTDSQVTEFQEGWFDYVKGMIREELHDMSPMELLKHALDLFDEISGRTTFTPVPAEKLHEAACLINN